MCVCVCVCIICQSVFNLKFLAPAEARFRSKLKESVLGLEPPPPLNPAPFSLSSPPALVFPSHFPPVNCPVPASSVFLCMCLCVYASHVCTLLKIHHSPPPSPSLSLSLSRACALTSKQTATQPRGRLPQGLSPYVTSLYHTHKHSLTHCHTAMEAGGGTNYEAAFRKAFSMADLSVSSNYDSGL